MIVSSYCLAREHWGWAVEVGGGYTAARTSMRDPSGSAPSTLCTGIQRDQSKAHPPPSAPLTRPLPFHSTLHRRGGAFQKKKKKKRKKKKNRRVRRDGQGHLGLLPPARDHRDEARRPSGRGWLSDGQAVGPMPLGTAHLRIDEGPPPEALLTSRRARSGEGLAPCAKVLRF